MQSSPWQAGIFDHLIFIQNICVFAVYAMKFRTISRGSPMSIRHSIIPTIWKYQKRNDAIDFPLYIRNEIFAIKSNPYRCRCLFDSFQLWIVLMEISCKPSVVNQFQLQLQKQLSVALRTHPRPKVEKLWEPLRRNEKLWETLRKKSVLYYIRVTKQLRHQPTYLITHPPRTHNQQHIAPNRTN